MNLLEKKIRYLLVSKKITLDKLCENMDMSKQNLYHIFRKDDTSYSNIKKMSKFFNVPLSYFFDDDLTDFVNVPVVDVSVLSDDDKDKKIRQLRRQVKELREKERILYKALSK